MIKLFIVDDEDIIRTGIRNSIERLNGEYVVCGEADNGEMALPLIQELKPDILLVDIQMPFMDGLDLSAVLKKSMPWIRIVVISGYDEFAYAQKALSIGVDHYLLKPVNAHKLLEVLQDVATRMEGEKHKLLQMTENQKSAELEEVLQREHLFSRLVVGAASIDSVSQFAKKHGMTLLASQYIACSAMLEELREEKLTNCRLLCKQLFDGREDVLWFFKGVDNLVLILTGDTRDDLRENAFETAQLLRHELERVLSMEAVIGVGSIVGHIEELPASYKDAHSIFLRGMQLRGGKIIGYSDIAEEAAEFLPDVPLDMHLNERLRCAVPADLPQIIDLHFGVTNHKSTDSVLFRYYQLTDLMVIVKRLLHEFGVQDGNMIEKPHRVLDIANSWEDMRKMALELLEKYIRLRDEQGRHVNNTHVRSACHIINSEYDDVTLSLHTVAARVGFSPNYFSAIFSQQTGQTFIEYLTGRRIEVAKTLLLDKKNRLQDIAERIGYSDPHYFSYVFKKNTGTSPRDYRNAVAG